MPQSSHQAWERRFFLTEFSRRAGVCVSHPVVSNSASPWTVTHHAPLSMEFSRQEYWSGLPFPSPGDLPDPRIEGGGLERPRGCPALHGVAGGL